MATKTIYTNEINELHDFLFDSILEDMEKDKKIFWDAIYEVKNLKKEDNIVTKHVACLKARIWAKSILKKQKDLQEFKNEYAKFIEEKYDEKEFALYKKWSTSISIKDKEKNQVIVKFPK